MRLRGPKVTDGSDDTSPSTRIVVVAVMRALRSSH
jgi:hypothetical protein